MTIDVLSEANCQSVVIAAVASEELWQWFPRRVCSALSATAGFWNPLTLLALVQFSVRESTGLSSPVLLCQDSDNLIEALDLGIRTALRRNFPSGLWAELVPTTEGARASKGGTILSPLAAEGLQVASEGNLGVLALVLFTNARWAVQPVSCVCNVSLCTLCAGYRAACQESASAQHPGMTDRPSGPSKYRRAAQSISFLNPLWHLTATIASNTNLRGI